MITPFGLESRNQCKRLINKVLGEKRKIDFSFALLTHLSAHHTLIYLAKCNATLGRLG